MEKWSHSKINTFIRCPEMFRWQYIVGIRPKIKSKPLVLGGCVASFLSEFRAEGTFEAGAEAFMQNWVDEDKGLPISKADDPMRSVERGLEILKAYTEFYPDEPAQIIRPEISFEEEVAPGIIFRGRIDGVIDDGTSIGIIEDKTASRLGDFFFVEKGNSYQVKWYMFIAEKLGLFDLSKNKLPRGVLNAIYIHKETLRFRREPILKMKKDIEEAGKDLLAWIAHINMAVSQNSFPKADYSMCAQYGGCDYLPLRRASGKNLERLIDANYAKSTYSFSTDKSTPKS